MSSRLKILIFCLPGIGDALMATPMVKLLKEKNPQAKIDIACMFNGVEYVFKNSPYVNRIYRLSLYKENKAVGLRQLLSLRKENYDISVLAFPAYRREYHLIQGLVGAKKRTAHRFNKGYWSEFNFLNTDLISVDENEHNLINNLNLLKAVNINWQEEIKKEDLKYDLILDQKDTDFGKNYIQNLNWDSKSITAVHPGSIRSRAGILKRWSIERYAQLVKHLIKEKKQKVLIFVGPDEIDLGTKLCCLINDKRNSQLINMKFNQAVGVLSQVNLLIGNDNGFAHLANALNIKTIILFGPTNIEWCSPYRKKTSINIRKAIFEPWFRNDMKVTHPPKDAKSGMEEIKVRDVIVEVDRCSNSMRLGKLNPPAGRLSFS